MPSTNTQFLLQLGVNLQTLEQGKDWIGKRLMIGRYGTERCRLAALTIKIHQGVLPSPNCEVEPSGAEDWLFLRTEFEIDLETAEAFGQHGTAQALQHGINLIDQHCTINPA